MLSKSRKDLCFGAIILLIGAAYLGLTVQLPRSGGIDSSTVPYILSIMITALGIIQIVIAMKALRRDAESARAQAAQPDPASGEAQTAPAARPDFVSVFFTGLLILLYVALLDTFGFMVMSALYLMLQISLLTPKYAKANYLKYAVISVVTAVVVYYQFYWAFDIMLPHGEFWYDRGINFEWSPFE